MVLSEIRYSSTLQVWVHISSLGLLLLLVERRPGIGAVSKFHLGCTFHDWVISPIIMGLPPYDQWQPASSVLSWIQHGDNFDTLVFSTSFLVLVSMNDNNQHCFDYLKLFIALLPAIASLFPAFWSGHYTYDELQWRYYHRHVVAFPSTIGTVFPAFWSWW